MVRTVYVGKNSFWVDFKWSKSGPVLFAIECLNDAMLYHRGWMAKFNHGQKLPVSEVQLYTLDREQKTNLEKALLEELKHEQAQSGD